MKNAMTKISTLILAILIFCFSVTAQDQKIGPSAEKDWVRIVNQNREISFAVPEDFSFVTQSDAFTESDPRNWTNSAEFKNVRAVTAFQNGATLFFESYDVNKAKKALPYLASRHSEGEASLITFENFSGLLFSFSDKTFRQFYYFASEDNIYLVGIASRQKNSETVNRFLNSVRLNGKPIFSFPVSITAEPKTVLSITNLKEIGLDAVKMSKEDKKEFDKKRKETKTVVDAPKDDTEPLVIVSKPRPSYTDQARNSGEQGVIRLRVVFKADGKLGKVQIIDGLRYGLTEKALIALRRLIFLPAEKNNVPQDLTRVVEFKFAVY